MKSGTYPLKHAAAANVAFCDEAIVASITIKHAAAANVAFCDEAKVVASITLKHAEQQMWRPPIGRRFSQMWLFNLF